MLIDEDKKFCPFKTFPNSSKINYSDHNASIFKMSIDFNINTEATVNKAKIIFSKEGLAKFKEITTQSTAL